MSGLEKDRFHRAARDGFLDLLKDATRKDCNQLDEDGMTPTLWAAYYGNLDALRTLVGRGGDPDRCDWTGNTALHWSCLNGHMNCVSFLVNFGVNLWALNNDFQTAKDGAALKQRSEILDFVDTVVAKQSALNPKVVQKLKEKAVAEAEKRIKSFERLQKKATKRAEKEEKTIEKSRKKLIEPITASIASTLRRDSVLSLQPKVTSVPLKFSDIVNTGTMNSKVRGFGAVSRKVQQRKQSDNLSTTCSADFKIRENNESGLKNASKSTVRSLTGLRRDNEVLYVRRLQQQPNHATQSQSQSNNNHFSHNNSSLAGKNVLINGFNGKPHMRDLFSFDDTSSGSGTLKQKRMRNGSTLTRTTSEPDFLSHFADSGLGDEAPSPPEASMFERPGFGSMAFRHSCLTTSNALPLKATNTRHENQENNHRTNGETKSRPGLCSGNGGGNGSGGSDSIGSAGSLAQRNATLSVISGQGVWDEDDLVLEVEGDEEEDGDEDALDGVNDPKRRTPITPPILLFLAAHGLCEYKSLFQEEKIDIEALVLLNEDDLKSLGLPLGPRRKLLKAIEKRKIKLDEPGLLRDSDL